MTDKKETLFSIFSKNEDKIAELYSIYSESFPKQKRMWNRMSREEIEHSMVLHVLDERYGGDLSYYSVTAEGPKILNYVSSFIDAEIERAKEGSLTARQAIATAMRLELSMIEKKCFEIFASSEQDIMLVLKKLNDETDEHFQRLKSSLRMLEN